MKRVIMVIALSFILSGYAQARDQLVENIGMLGYSEDVSCSLAKEVRAKHFIRVSINVNIPILAVVKDGLLLPHKFRNFCWDDNRQCFLAERYEAKGFKLYRFKNKGSEYLFRLDEFPKAQAYRNESPAEYVQPQVQQAPAPSLSAKEPTRLSGYATREWDETKETKNQETVIEHQPQGGVYYAQNELSSWRGGYVKLKSNFNSDSGIEPGFGFLGNALQSRSENGFRYWETAIGPLTGVKVFGTSKKGYPNMTEVDLALQYYWMGGRNTSSGYKVNEEGYRLNGRIERQQMISERWTLGGVIDGNLDLHNTMFRSTWSGDSPNNHSSLEIGGYGLYQLNEDWEYQIYLAGVRQWWDDLYGVKAIPLEFRYHQWFIIGAGLNFYPFGLGDAYKGISAADLTSPFAFIRIDGRPLMKGWNAEANGNRVTPLEE